MEEVTARRVRPTPCRSNNMRGEVVNDVSCEFLWEYPRRGSGRLFLLKNSPERGGVSWVDPCSLIVKPCPSGKPLVICMHFQGFQSAHALPRVKPVVPRAGRHIHGNGSHLYALAWKSDRRGSTSMLFIYRENCFDASR